MIKPLTIFAPALCSLTLCGLTLLCASPAWAGESDTGCEVILMEPVEYGTTVASFRPADAFLESVYDDDVDHLKSIDDLRIRGMICQRTDIIPTLRDFPILATGISLSLSEDFDSPDSRLMTLFYKDGAFQHVYKGPSLSEAEAATLADRLDVFNLQPHDLPKPDPKPTPSDDPKIQPETKPETLPETQPETQSE